jgi:hypothetical protein
VNGLFSWKTTTTPIVTSAACSEAMVMLIAADFIPPANGNTHMMTEVAITAASRPAGSSDCESPSRWARAVAIALVWASAYC